MDPCRQGQRRRDLRGPGLTRPGSPSAFPSTDAADGPRDLQVAGAFGALQVAVVAITAWTVHTFGVRVAGDPRVGFPGRALLGGLVRWDGGWYLGIAEHGYSLVPGRQSSVAFFPLYPLLIRAGSAVTGQPVLTAMAISSASGCVAAVLLGRWARLHGLDRGARVVTLALFLLFPYAWYLYGVVYSDALFVALALAAALAVEHGRVELAGVLLIATTADRSTGAAVALGLCVLHLERRGVLRFGVPSAESPARARWRPAVAVVREAFRPRDLTVLVGFGGLAAWMTFLAARFDDPLAFLTAQRAWGQGGTLGTLFKRQYLWEVTHLVHRSFVLTATFQGVLLLGALALVPAVGRRFGHGYGVMQAALIAMPLIGGKDFMGGGRYLLVLFPAFALVGERLAAVRPTTRWTTVAVSATLLVVGTAAFAGGVYLA